MNNQDGESKFQRMRITTGTCSRDFLLKSIREAK